MQDPAAQALFSKAKRQILGLLFGHPKDRYYLRQVAQMTGLAVGHVQRELSRLAAAGIVTRTAEGRQVYYGANASCPIFEELQSLVGKTLGVGTVLGQALTVLSTIDVAFVFGSVARGEQRGGSDIDLMVIGEVSFADVVRAIRPAETQLGRVIEPVVYAPNDLREKMSEHGGFVARVIAGEKIFVVGTAHELAALSGQ